MNTKQNQVEFLINYYKNLAALYPDVSVAEIARKFRKHANKLVETGDLSQEAVNIACSIYDIKVTVPVVKETEVEVHIPTSGCGTCVKKKAEKKKEEADPCGHSGGRGSSC